MSKLFKILVTFAGLALLAGPALAHEKGDWVVRAGIGTVDPESTAYSNSVDDVRVVVDSGTAVTLSAVKMLTDNWGFEILAATPFSHDVSIGAVSVPGLIEIGEVKHLPPTFSFQYHFIPGGTFQPYVGLGLNYTTFFSEKIDQSLLPGADLSVDDSFGVAAQLGADIKLSDEWLITIDARWIGIEADATLFDGVSSETIALDINPLVYNINVGFKF
jgi:outer membrane protein